MKTKNAFRALLLAGLWAAFPVVRSQADVVVSDTYNVTGSGTGFNLGSGVNTGINPPTTRLTGTAAASLRYYLTTTTKTNTAFSISGSKLQVVSAANPGRFSLSTNGTTPFDFAASLGANSATPQVPVMYDLSITMANNSAGTQRFSFALGTSEGDATTWDFGVQVFHTAASDNFYTVAKRIDTGSSGLAADLNMFITNTAPGTDGTALNIVVRVTDAGSETTTFNSRVQVSIDGGTNWVYDTMTDPDLPNGFRLNGAGRYIMWDIAPDAGPVTYDNFSVKTIPLSGNPVYPADGGSVNIAPTLKVDVANTLSNNVTVTYFGREVGKPYPGPDFTIPVMPDTQNYSDYTHDGLHTIFYAQTEWIITNRVQRNIAYVAQLGDIVQHGDTGSGAGNDEEWEVSTNAMYRLENPARTLLRYGIPYGCCVGNHDQEPNGDENGTTTHYNQYFSKDHFANKPYYGGNYDTNSDSFYNLFSASGLDFIVLSFEYGRYGSGVLGWAQDVLANYPKRRIIVMTHHAGSDYTPSSLSAQGQAIYDALSPNTNFFLMLGGHVFNGTGWGEGSRTNTSNGHKVYTLVSDYQNRPNGGNGLMRLMTFSPSSNMIFISTYSPYTDSYETDFDSEFQLPYNMQLPTGPGTPGTAFAPLGTNVNVASGSRSTLNWSGLQTNKNYEWYAVVTDGTGNSFTTPTSGFTTVPNVAPVANSRSLTIVGDQPLQLTLGASDANGDALTFRINPPTHGLLSNVDTNSGSLTYLPARGYRGSDAISFFVNDGVANSGLASVSLNVISPTDANTNGLPDVWESQFGISDPNGDADGDGQNNLAEYIAGTNPTNAMSLLRVVDAKLQGNGQCVLSWSSVGGTRYRVQYANSLDGAFTDISRPLSSEMDASPSSSTSSQSFTDPSIPANGVRYYRVKVVP